MWHRASLSVLLCAGLVPACNASDSAGRSDAATSDATRAPSPEVSPFAPQAIEAVLDAMVGAVTAARLPSSAKPPIAVLLKDLTGFWAPVATGANRMSIRLTVPSVVEAPLIVDPANTDSNHAAALQNQFIDNYLSLALYRGMALAVMADNSDTVGYVNRFVDQRGPVVTIDSDSPSSERSYVIATANYQAGYTAATMLAQSMTPGDTIVVFGSTDLNWPSGIERAQGAEDAASAAGLRIAPRVSPLWADDQDLSALEAALADPKLAIKGMVCVYSDAYLCARAVEETVGVPGAIKIVGFDMATATKTYFDKGYFTGIAVQRQYYMGQLGLLVPYAIDVLGAAATRALLAPLLTEGNFIDTGIDIITTDNYPDYMSFLSLLGINA